MAMVSSPAATVQLRASHCLSFLQTSSYPKRNRESPPVGSGVRELRGRATGATPSGLPAVLHPERASYGADRCTAVVPGTVGGAPPQPSATTLAPPCCLVLGIARGGGGPVRPVAAQRGGRVVVPGLGVLRTRALLDEFAVVDIAKLAGLLGRLLGTSARLELLETPPPRREALKHRMRPLWEKPTRRRCPTTTRTLLELDLFPGAVIPGHQHTREPLAVRALPEAPAEGLVRRLGMPDPRAVPTISVGQRRRCR